MRLDRTGAMLALVSLTGAALVVSSVVATARTSAAPAPARAQVDRPVTPGPVAQPARAARPAVLSTSLPVHVSIPAIGVSSRLLHVGQAADGTVAVPPPGPTYDWAAWYRYSPAPGSRGPSVIVGHVDSARSGASVFFSLGALRAGDRVDVSRADGSLAHFAVTQLRHYAKDRFPTAAVYGDTPGSELRLVTCTGAFDRKAGHYRDNLVVSAVLLPPTAAPSPSAL